MTMSTEGRCASGKIIPAQFVRVKDASKLAAPAPRPLPQHAQHREAKITLVKDGETVRAIEVQCSCGAVIRLDCEY